MRDVTLTCNWRSTTLFQYSDGFFLRDVDSKLSRFYTVQVFYTILTLSIRYSTTIDIIFIWLICTSACSLISQVQLWHWSRTLIFKLELILYFLFWSDIIFNTLIHLNRAKVALFIRILWRFSNFWRTTINFLVFLKEAGGASWFPSIIWIFLRCWAVFWAFRL